MRIVESQEPLLGSVDIATLVINPKNRDAVSKILKGLQFIYLDAPVRLEIFALLESEINPKISKNNGRPGMHLWKILVMGVLRLTLSMSYDLLHNLVNRHDDIRKILGDSSMLDRADYNLQTIKDNVSLLTPELLDKINQIVVKAGHKVIKKKAEDLAVRCDSFVLESNVHFPTDISLLWDAMRKVVTLTARVSEKHELTDFRQFKYNLRDIKQSIRIAQLAKRGACHKKEKDGSASSAIDPITTPVVGIANTAQKKMEEAYRACIDTAKKYLGKAKATIKTLEETCDLGDIDMVSLAEIQVFSDHAERQIDQTDRRVLQGEVIPQDQKVFSLFKPFTEWISKGKAGVPVELGLRVAIVEDQFRFILHHNVMEKVTDDKIAVSIIEETKQRLSSTTLIHSCSFDKGFHSPANQEALAKEVSLVVLPRKGKLSQVAKEIENRDSFKRLRRKHSAVESAINALEVHGLDYCPDAGIGGFKRYVALAIVGHNIHRIGAILIQQEREAAVRKAKKQKKILLAVQYETLEKMAA